MKTHLEHGATQGANSRLHPSMTSITVHARRSVTPSCLGILTPSMMANSAVAAAPMAAAVSKTSVSESRLSPVSNAASSQVPSFLSIHAEAARGNVDAVVSILQAAPGSAHSRDSQGRTPLHFAAISQSKQMVTELVRSGAVVDICDNQSKTALHWAVAAGNIELAGHLLDLGADVNRPFSSGETAAHLAAFLEQHDTLGFLLSRGASPNATDCQGRTPLHMAAMVGDKRCIQLLLAAGAAPCQPDRLGRVALHCTCARGHAEATRVLLQSGDCSESYDKNGVTPLYLAAFKGHERCVSVLLEEHKANIEAIDLQRGTTALHAASAMGKASVVRLLLLRGANWQAITRHGQRAIDLAREGGHEEVVQLLQLAPPPPRSPSTSPTSAWKKRLGMPFSSYDTVAQGAVGSLAKKQR